MKENIWIRCLNGVGEDCALERKQRLVEQVGIYAADASKQRLSCRLQETAVPQVDVVQVVGGRKRSGLVGRTSHRSLEHLSCGVRTKDYQGRGLQGGANIVWWEQHTGPLRFNTLTPDAVAASGRGVSADICIRKNRFPDRAARCRPTGGGGGCREGGETRRTAISLVPFATGPLSA
jgi:hypothetical protein